MFFYTYILFSLKDKQFYIGFTSNLKRRLKEHLLCKTKSTAHRKPLKLIYFEGHRSKTDAMRRESYFKTDKGKTTLRLMIRNSLDNHFRYWI
jgi:putative endonuclease